MGTLPFSLCTVLLLNGYFRRTLSDKRSSVYVYLRLLDTGFFGPLSIRDGKD